MVLRRNTRSFKRYTNEKYDGDKFTIIAFPANDFVTQEPGTDDEIKEFCTKNYSVSFSVMSEIILVPD